VSWLRGDEVLTERESEFLKSINMDASVPQSSAIISPMLIKIPDRLKAVYRSSSLVSSLPDRNRFNKRFSSYDTPSHHLPSFTSSSHHPRLSLRDLRHRFRSRSSEPILNYDHEMAPSQGQTIVISNHSGNKSNQIILKSSFSDQNLTTNINADKMNFNCSVQYLDEPVIPPLPLPIERTSFHCVGRDSSSGTRSVRRRLPKIPSVPRNTQSLYMPSFPTVFSMNLDVSPISPRFGKSLSVDASVDDGDNFCVTHIISDKEEANPILCSLPVTDWAAKNVSTSRFEKFECEPSERRYSRENLKLDLRCENKPNSPRMQDSIKAIIDNVMTQLVLSENDEKEVERRSSLKIELEGKVVLLPRVPPTAGIDVCEAFDKKKNTLRDEACGFNEIGNMFEKCRSRTVSEEDGSEPVSADDDDDNGDEVADDDVFDAPFSRQRNSSFGGKQKASSARKKRSSSLEGKLNVRKSSSGKSTRNSSTVSINETPEYFEYTVPIKTTKSSKIASSHAIAKLNTKPKRGSLKKSSASKSPTKKNTQSTSSRSSDYDRGRSRNVEGCHRESFKKNDRTNERSSELEAIDREHKDGNLNRSLSNTDTNIEDRIGEP
jgi:hypothetical protein